MLNIHALLHVDFEDLGCIADWAATHNHSVSHTRFYDDDWELPSLESIDWLIIMGGPMGVRQESKYPWLAAEKAFIRQAIDAGITVLGICLGAQLIAHALGAKVSKNPQKEIGWLPIQLNEAGKSHPLFKGLPSTLMTVFHWHGDTFSVPTDAACIAYSQACDNQGFVYDASVGGYVVGLQCHFEVTLESLKQMIQHGRSEINKEPSTNAFVQSADDMLAMASQHVEQNNTWMFRLLDNLAKS